MTASHNFTIEPLTFADYDAVITFWHGQEGIGLNESDERIPMERYLARNPGMSLIAKNSAGAIVGAVLCGHDGRRGYLHHLAVASDYRRKGLGTALVQRCLAQLSAAQIPKCNIFLFNDNADGRRFWERLGYKMVSWSPMQRVI
ncbi:MAG TPA: GNAT family N-acetyltransferase [Phycisphaerae bacterium]|nr:GNAT family N-acetyltransferase [Phycisphaerae bacterium]